jgi:S-adenosylmethionine hydrolase
VTPAGGPPGTVFFLSDYGTDDEFVGVVHAVLHRLAPGLAVIDLSHRIPPFDVAAGAAMLVRCAPALGPGVVLAVVDPGVGSGRRAVAARTGSGHWLVGPDNGLLSPVADALGGVAGAVRLDSRVGGTFDGRDVFAPAAAHLAGDGDPGALGPEVDPDTLQPGPDAADRGDPTVAAGPSGPELVTSVTWVDRFGNVQLDLGPGSLDALGITTGSTAAVLVAGREPAVVARRVGTFAQLGPDELGLLLDANGRAALVVDCGSAAAALGVAGAGTPVRVIASHG